MCHDDATLMLSLDAKDALASAFVENGTRDLVNGDVFRRSRQFQMRHRQRRRYDQLQLVVVEILLK